jgi:hypothetical protein
VEPRREVRLGLHQFSLRREIRAGAEWVEYYCSRRNRVRLFSGTTCYSIIVSTKGRRHLHVRASCFDGSLLGPLHSEILPSALELRVVIRLTISSILIQMSSNSRKVFIRLGDTRGKFCLCFFRPVQFLRVLHYFVQNACREWCAEYENWCFDCTILGYDTYEYDTMI